MFATWVRWAVLFGKGWMTEDGSAVVLMRSPGKAHMSLRSMIRAGMLPTPFKIGTGGFRRFYFEIESPGEFYNGRLHSGTPVTITCFWLNVFKTDLIDIKRTFQTIQL